MTNSIWDTTLREREGVIHGPFRMPLQMLAEQEYGGHLSIHDSDQAKSLGFIGAPIEGPTHFSQFDPLLHTIWGDNWLESGCISAHFKNMVIEGEEVQAFAKRPDIDDNLTRIWAVKKTGEIVLEGTASLGPEHPETELDRIMSSRPTPDNLVILEQIKIGDRSILNEAVKIDFGQHLGDSYPFTLNQKLEKITEPCKWYSPVSVSQSPWRQPIIPIEMINPLVSFKFNDLLQAKQPSIGLFADLEIKLINGPLLVGQEYLLEKEVVGLGESRRTESMWVKTSVFRKETKDLVATVLLNTAVLKDSYPAYEEEAKKIGKL